MTCGSKKVEKICADISESYSFLLLSFIPPEKVSVQPGISQSPSPGTSVLCFATECYLKLSYRYHLGYWHKQQEQGPPVLGRTWGPAVRTSEPNNKDVLSPGCTGQKQSPCHCFHFPSSKKGTFGRMCEWQVISRKLKTQLSDGNNKSSHLSGVYCVPGLRQST